MFESSNNFIFFGADRLQLEIKKTGYSRFEFFSTPNTI